MKIPGRVSDVVRSLAGSGVLAAVVFFALALAAQSMAGAVSAQPANSLNITGSTAWVLARPTSERGWLSDSHMSGFVRQTIGLKGDWYRIDTQPGPGRVTRWQ